VTSKNNLLSLKNDVNAPSLPGTYNMWLAKHLEIKLEFFSIWKGTEEINKFRKTVARTNGSEFVSVPKPWFVKQAKTSVNVTLETFRFNSSLSSASRVLRVLVSQVGVQMLRLLSHVRAVVTPVPATVL
jgi:hypothetical protein